MKRSELREHIFKLLFGVEFREDADFTEQTGTYVREIEGADEKEQEYIQTKVQDSRPDPGDRRADQYTYQRMEDQPYEQGGSYDLKTGRL